MTTEAITAQWIEYANHLIKNGNDLEALAMRTNLLAMSGKTNPTVQDDAGYEALLKRLPDTYEGPDAEFDFGRHVWNAARDSVVFPPLSEYRDKLREMICEGDFDFTKIFEEIEYEGDTYTDISNEGADALADYFIDLFEQIDENRSEQVGR